MCCVIRSCEYTFNSYFLSQGIADAYRKQHPNGSATVTQFQARPQLLVREQLTHRPAAYSYADAVFSPVLPAPTPESLRYVQMASPVTPSSAIGLTPVIIFCAKLGPMLICKEQL